MSVIKCDISSDNHLPTVAKFSLWLLGLSIFQQLQPVTTCYMPYIVLLLKKHVDVALISSCGGG